MINLGYAVLFDDDENILYHPREDLVNKKFFSEYALIKYRLRIEVEYFIALFEVGIPQLDGFPKDKYNAIREIYSAFTPEQALRVKEIESVTNHDVKAVEYFLKERFAFGLKRWYVPISISRRTALKKSSPILTWGEPSP